MSVGMDGEGLAGRVELVRRPCRWSDQGSQSLTLSCPHHRYEEEINRRTAAENEFVVLKKVSLEALAGMGCGRQEALGATSFLGWEEANVHQWGLSFRMWTVPT